MSKFRVYVAASSQELARVEEVVEKLEARGVEVEGKWTQEIRAHGSQAADVPRAARQQRSYAIREALCVSDALLFLTPCEGHTTEGGWFECGFAEGAGWLALVASGDELPRFILDSEPWIHATSDDAAIEAVIEELIRRSGVPFDPSGRYLPTPSPRAHKNVDED